MSIRKLKIRPNPDFGRIEKVLRRQGVPDRVPFYELFSNIERDVLSIIGKHEDLELRQHINYMFSLGYDYISVSASQMKFNFPQKEHPKTITSQGERSYLTATTHTISNRKEFEEYPWPAISNIDYSLFEKIGKFIPEGMKVIVLGPGGILENVMWLLGYEGISYLIYDDEQLIKDIFEAVATRIIQYFDSLASSDMVGALTLGDDMGFKTQTLLSPEILRKYVFPWHKKLVETVHKHGKPIILHSCGNLSEVMQDIIDCGWDAKHSFEDTIEPVWETKKKYGKHIALLGGFDMDKISRISEEEVRAHTRFLIEKCAPGGGWALGTGNSVANYVPVRNFLAMLEEGYLAGNY
jgi:uroporphyrinogen decarboxylase